MSMNRKYAYKSMVDNNEQQWSFPNFDRYEIKIIVEFIYTALA